MLYRDSASTTELAVLTRMLDHAASRRYTRLRLNLNLNLNLITWRSAWHSHRDCGVHFGPDFSTKPRIRPATDCAAHLATESVSESASRGATRDATDRRTQIRTRCGAEGLSRGGIGCCIDSDRRRATETRAKSLIQKHIHRRARRGTVSRIDSGNDSPLAGASAGSNSRHHVTGRDDSRHEPQDFHDGFALGERIYI